MNEKLELILLTEALIKKSGEITEQARERYVEELTVMFEKDIELFEEYVSKLNIYESMTIDDWSHDRDKIAIYQYLQKCEVMMSKGFSVEVAKRLLKLYHDTCMWSVEKLSPVLSEYSRKLDAINEDLKAKVESQNEEIKETREVLQESKELLEDLRDIVKNTDDEYDMVNKIKEKVLGIFEEEEDDIPEEEPVEGEEKEEKEETEEPKYKSKKKRTKKDLYAEVEALK